MYFRDRNTLEMHYSLEHSQKNIFLATDIRARNLLVLLAYVQSLILSGKAIFLTSERQFGALPV